jgi:glycerate 2-kinase
VRVVVAPDKFKGSATAQEVAAALTAGLLRAAPGLDVIQLPVADGGDGTVAAALAWGFEPVAVTAEGPVGDPVLTTFAVKDRTAIIELADVAGLRRLPGWPPGGRPAALAPLTASTYGVGQVIAAALDAGARTIVLGIGGSASTDGGAGLVQALGIQLTGSDGSPLARGGAALASLARIDTSGLDRRLAGVSILVASDVGNPLLGAAGAARVFGPQKGASPRDVAELDQALARWSELTSGVTGADVAATPGAGAAGGTGFAALAYLGARLAPGIDVVLDLTGFAAVAAAAALVITGEGSLDRQTLGGKAPLGVARAAVRLGVPVVAVAGRMLLTAEELSAAGFAAAYSLSSIEPAPESSMARVAELLEQVGAEIAASSLLSPR